MYLCVPYIYDLNLTLSLMHHAVEVRAGRTYICMYVHNVSGCGMERVLAPRQTKERCPGGTQLFGLLRIFLYRQQQQQCLACGVSLISDLANRRL